MYKVLSKEQQHKILASNISCSSNICEYLGDYLIDDIIEFFV